MNALGFPIDDPVCVDVAGRDCEGSFMRAKADAVSPQEPFQSTLNSAHSETEPGHRTLSDLALELVNGPRQDAYGEPVAHMQRVATVWRGLFGWDVTPRTAALALAALKIVREAHKPAADNRVDLAGYVAIEERCAAVECA